jgi:3D (Asp-Asp-Asp) domain-containing protein
MNIIKNIKKIAILGGRSYIAKSVFSGILVVICFVGVLTPHATDADYIDRTNASYVAREVVKKVKVVLTAYSSTPDQTDDTPFITANGKHVIDGIVANNMLPFGTKIRIPSIYGYKIFTVEDRMNARKSKYHVDIWMPDRESAINFGVKITEIEILKN